MSKLVRTGPVQKRGNWHLCYTLICFVSLIIYPRTSLSALRAGEIAQLDVTARGATVDRFVESWT